MHVAQHVRDPQLLARTGAAVDVQPGGLGEGSAQRRDGQGARQGRCQATLGLFGQRTARRAPPPAPAGQPCASRGVHAQGPPSRFRGRCWVLPTFTGRTAQLSRGGEEGAGLAAERVGTRRRRARGGSRGPGETGGLRGLGGRGPGPCCVAAEAQYVDPEGLGAGWFLGTRWRATGTEASPADRRKIWTWGVGKGAEGHKAGLGRRDRGPGIWARSSGAGPLSRKDPLHIAPFPHRSAGVRAGWHCSLLSLAGPQPVAEGTQALTNPQRPDGSRSGPLPASFFSTSSGSPPQSSPITSSPGRVADSLCKASRDW